MSIECKYLRRRDGSPRSVPSLYLVEYEDGRKRRTYLRRGLIKGLEDFIGAAAAPSGRRRGRPPVLPSALRELLAEEGFAVSGARLRRRRRSASVQKR